jgi:ferredoxin-NADP reductase
VIVASRRDPTADTARFELVAADDQPLPAFDAGAHIDVVVAPEYLRAYSLAGDPADRSRWIIGVRREVPGRGGSALVHRAFRPGRRVFVSKPRNHFPLREDAAMSWLFAGGIGVTPLLTMAHRLHALGRPFELHYSVRGRGEAAFLDAIVSAPWAARAQLHDSAAGQRARLDRLVPPFAAGHELYTCGSAAYMDAVFEAAQARGWPPEALHREFFSAPEAPGRVDHAFQLLLLRSGRVLEVPAHRSAADVLADQGLAVPVKCADGLCGVCAVPYDARRSGEVDHRDVVLSAAQRRDRIVLCCSRGVQGAVVAVDL